MRTVAGIVLSLMLIIGSSSVVGAVQKIQSLCQYHYPSDYLYQWKCVRLTWNDTPRRVFGKYWKDGLRFNRMDRRHFIGGISVKVPRPMKQVKDFNPMPPFYEEAELEPQFILIDQNEMFLGAYEYGDLVFSTPVAVGIDGYRLKNGSYRVDAVHARHESSLYRMEGTDRPYPMHYGLRFYTEKKQDGWTTYWLHGRDIPGYPASHGCIGLYDEEMQRAYYNEPERPILMDARKLYEWVVRDTPDHTGEFQSLINGPKVLIVGEPPVPDPENGMEAGINVVPASGRPGQRP